MKPTLLLLALMLLTALFSAGAFAEEAVYPTTIGSLDAMVTINGHGSVEGLKEGEEARLETITFQDTEFQTVDSIHEELHINGKTIYPKYILDEYGNKYLQFHITENGQFDYQITAEIKRNALEYSITDFTIPAPDESVKLYTQPSEKVESNSTEILTLANNKIFGNTFVPVLNQTIDWVNGYVEYASGDDFRKYYLEQYSAVETLLNKKGVCDEFAELGTALLRAKNIPTRLAIGITFDGLEWGNHAWLEVYNQNLKKWIPSDPTFREAGFVDAMHLKMGAFDDVTNSKAKCYYPSSAKCTIENHADLPQVTIINKEYMQDVTLDSNITTLKANIWNDVPLTITNLTNGVLSVPIKMRDIQGVLVQEKKKSVILSPGQKETVIFKVLPRISLEENQIAKGTMVFNSLSQPYEKEITVERNDNTDSGAVVVEDITPIAHEGTLKIQITATNYYAEDKNIQVKIKGGNYTSNTSEIIPSLSTKTASEEIQNYSSTPYDINILTPDARLLSQIIPVKTQSATIQHPQQTIIEQRLPAADQNQSMSESIISNPIGVIIGLLAGIVVMLFGLFLVNKRYV